MSSFTYQKGIFQKLGENDGFVKVIQLDLTDALFGDDVVDDFLEEFFSLLKKLLEKSGARELLL